MEAPRSPLAYFLSRTALRLLFAPACRIRFLHRSRSAKPGPWILAPNHISHFDPPLLSVASKRQIDWMAMEELFSDRLFTLWLRAIGAFSVSRGKPDRRALRTAARRLSQGRVVGIFPEGGIRDGAASVLEGAPVRPGLSLVAALARTPVVPCVILGSDRLYNARRWLPLRRTPIWIAFGNDLPPPDQDPHGRQQFELRLRAALSNLRDEMIAAFHLRPQDLPRPPKIRRHEP